MVGMTGENELVSSGNELICGGNDLLNGGNVRAGTLVPARSFLGGP